MDELLAKGVIEPSSDGAGFYSSVFVVPECTIGLWPILYLKQFNNYFHIPSLKIPTIRHILCLFSVVIMPSPLIARMLIYILQLLNTVIFLQFV